jgi:pimeloyl-ACP methyl ester carboxylesterase
MTSLREKDKYDSFRQSLYSGAIGVKAYKPEDYPGEDQNISRLRRARPPAKADPRVAFTLTETDGVLHWEPGYGFAAPGRRRAFRAGPLMTGRVIAPVNAERLGESEVGAFLEHFDKQLTPNCDPRNPEAGLRQLSKGAWSGQAVQPRKDGRILLFVHGTFSNVDTYLKELRTIPAGRAFLGEIEEKYDQVLGFDHATLSASPVMNALDLARLFQNCQANVDVIAHSRGGLVTRWWLEQLDNRGDRSTRSILAGSPLDGTSLAAPDRLRGALDLLTNVAHALESAGELASSTIPFLTVVTGLMRVICSVTPIAAKTPALDAVLAMIPGLGAQSQVENNNERFRLNQIGSRKLEYYAIRGDFRTDDPGWRFWRYFVDLGDRVKEAGANVVFQSENDLVVNTASMAVLARWPSDNLIEPGRILDFEGKDKVYHTIYFRQEKTVKFIRECFGLDQMELVRRGDRTKGGKNPAGSIS